MADDLWSSLNHIIAPASTDRFGAATGANAGGYSERREFIYEAAPGKYVAGPAATNYLLNLAAGAAPRGVVTDFNTSGDVGAMISFTQGGISNNCFGTVPGTADFGWYVNRNGVADGTELMRLTSTGKLGIGTGLPSKDLEIFGASATVRITNKNSADLGGMEICSGGQHEGSVTARGSTGELNIAAGRSVGWGGHIKFITDTVEKWRILSGGTLRPATDNVHDIGAGSNRVKVIFAGTGTINTSDAREKTWRGAASGAELAAAKRIAAELGFYQWNDAIAEKGPDDARLHFGVRAQAVWAIMANEGLIDPIGEGVRPDSRYAFLCYDEWDTVEAVDEVRDEEGNVVSPAVPAQPGGNRFGVRPDQLALFLIAAQEARLAALEAAS